MDKLADRIEKFAWDATEPFTISECVPKVAGARGKPKSLERKVQEALLGHPNVVPVDKERYVPRVALFGDARFRMAPTEWELERGVFVPGHRFIPFRNASVRSDEYKLVDGATGQALPMKRIRARVADVTVYYELLGFDEWVIASDVRRDAGRTDSETELVVWDMAEWYGRHEYVAGDTILATVEDLARGIYRIEPAKADRLAADFGRIREADTALEQAVLKVMADDTAVGLLEHQVFQAFATLDRRFLRQPGRHLGGLLSDNPRLAFSHVGAGPVLHRPGEEPLKRWFEEAEDQVTEPRGRRASLDAIFQDLGISVDETFVRAMIRDELSKNGDRDHVLKTIFPGEEPHFFDERQADSFFSKFDQLWVRLSRAEQRRPSAPAERRLRRQAVELQVRIIGILRRLDAAEARLSELPQDPMMAMLGIQNVAQGMLELLENRSEPVEVDEQSLATIDMVDEALDTLEANIFGSLQ